MSHFKELPIAGQNSSDQTVSTNRTDSVPGVDMYTNVYIYTGITIGLFVFGLLRALMFFKVAVDASQSLHNRMFSRMLRAQINFFDTHPVGEWFGRICC